MKKILLFAILVALVSSCMQYGYLRHQYPDNIHWKEINKPYDVVFDDVIDFMVENGYTLDRVDRQNGIVEMVLFIPFNFVTYEVKDGINDPKAFAVSAYPANTRWYYGRIIFRVKPSSNTQSLLGVRMVAFSRDVLKSGESDFFRTKTTGVYEKMTLEIIEKMGK